MINLKKCQLEKWPTGKMANWKKWPIKKWPT